MINFSVYLNRHVFVMILSDLHQDFLQMNWEDPHVKDEFKQKLADSSIMHYCISKTNDSKTVSFNLGASELTNITKTRLFKYIENFISKKLKLFR